jgi:hypothetical protein
MQKLVQYWMQINRVDYSITNRMQLQGDNGGSFTMHEVRFTNGEVSSSHQVILAQ